MMQPVGPAREAGWGSGAVGYGAITRDAGAIQVGWMGSGDRIGKEFVLLFSLILFHHQVLFLSNDALTRQHI